MMNHILNIGCDIQPFALVFGARLAVLLALLTHILCRCCAAAKYGVLGYIRRLKTPCVDTCVTETGLVLYENGRLRLLLHCLRASLRPSRSDFESECGTVVTLGECVAV